VNGVAVGTGRQQIDRPKNGASVAVVVKAPNYAPASIILDESSDPERTVELAAAPAATASAKETKEPPKDVKQPATATATPTAAKPPPASTGVGKTPAAKPPAAKPPAGKAPAIPANPY